MESVLFLAKEPLSTRRLAQLARLEDGTAARTKVRRIGRRLDKSGRAFCLVEVAGGFQLLTRPQFAPWIRRWVESGGELRISGPAMETLSVVAYRQPVLRAEIETIRGVQCGEILRQLMERGLVRIAGRSNELGRPFLYGTTRKFMQLFGLRHLEDLPRAEQLLKSLVEGHDSEGITNPNSVGDSKENGSMSATIAATVDKELVEAASGVYSQDAASQGKYGAMRNTADPDDDLEDEEDDDLDDDDDDDEDWDDDEDDLEDDDDLEDEEWEEVEDDEDWDDDEDDDWDDDDDDDDEDEWDDKA